MDNTRSRWEGKNSKCGEIKELGMMFEQGMDKKKESWGVGVVIVVVGGCWWGGGGVSTCGAMKR